MKLHNLDFASIAKKVEEVIDECPPEEGREDGRTSAERRKAMTDLWSSSRPIVKGCIADLYLRSRAIELESFPECLRFSEDAEYSKIPTIIYPALIARVVGPSGDSVNIMRVFLKPDGTKERKLMRGTFPPGSAIRLATATEELGIAEGLETALSARILHGTPTWSVLNYNGMESFQIPAGVKRLCIFGDNDESYTGQASAYLLARTAKRKGVDSKVFIPERVGWDWNHVLRKEGP